MCKRCEQSDKPVRRAVICELNPAHTGHARLFSAAKQRGETLICILSGNFVQRGEVAIADKFARAACAMCLGADLVVLLPTVFACAGAELFADGGVQLAGAFGADELWFGSECGDVPQLKAAAAALQSVEFSQKIQPYLQQGLGFADARSRALEEMLPGSAELLRGANNTLGIEYCKAIQKQHVSIQPQTVLRTGAGHDEAGDRQTPSAGYLRSLFYSGKREEAYAQMPDSCAEILREQECRGRFPCEMRHIERAVLAALRTKTQADFAALPDVSEGLEARLFTAAQKAGSLEAFYALAKTRRYSHARLRRVSMAAFAGIHRMEKVPYAQVLRMNEAGAAVLKDCTLPLICRYADVLSLSANAQALYRAECRVDDLFALSMPTPAPCGETMTTGLWRI